MNWTVIATLADLTAGIGVLISLIYVSRQIKMNTRAVRSANATTAQTNFQQLARFLYEDREGAALMLRAMNGDSALAPHERLAAYAYSSTSSRRQNSRISTICAAISTDLTRPHELVRPKA